MEQGMESFVAHTLADIIERLEKMKHEAATNERLDMHMARAMIAAHTNRALVALKPLVSEAIQAQVQAIVDADSAIFEAWMDTNERVIVRLKAEHVQLEAKQAALTSPGKELVTDG